MRKDLSGDREAAAEHIGLAQTRLAELKNLMTLGGLQQMMRSITLPGGVELTVASVFGQDYIAIHVPPADSSITGGSRDEHDAGRVARFIKATFKDTVHHSGLLSLMITRPQPPLAPRFVVITRASDGTIVWDSYLGTGRLLPYAYPAGGLVVSPNGLYVGGLGGNGAAWAYNTATGALATYTVHYRSTLIAINNGGQIEAYIASESTTPVSVTTTTSVPGHWIYYPSGFTDFVWHDGGQTWVPTTYTTVTKTVDVVTTEYYDRILIDFGGTPITSRSGVSSTGAVVVYDGWGYRGRTAPALATSASGATLVVSPPGFTYLGVTYSVPVISGRTMPAVGIAATAFPQPDLPQPDIVSYLSFSA